MSVDWRDCVLGGHGVTVRGWRAEPASSHGGTRSGTFTHLFLGLVTGRAGFRGRGPGLRASSASVPGPLGRGVEGEGTGPGRGRRSFSAAVFAFLPAAHFCWRSSRKGSAAGSVFVIAEPEFSRSCWAAPWGGKHPLRVRCAGTCHVVFRPTARHQGGLSH